MKIAVLGLGVAGSVLAYLALNHGLDVVAYEPCKSYMKRCGEAIPYNLLEVLGRYKVPLPRVVDKVFRIVFRVGEIERVVDSRGEPLWVVVDKKEWVNELRSLVPRVVYRAQSPEKVSADLVFDCRGPYSWGRRVTIVLQCYARCSYDPVTALLSYDPDRRMLMWVFPRGELHNVGCGMLGAGTPPSRALLEKLTGRMGVRCVFYDCGYSPLALDTPLKLAAPRGVRVGEAAGLVRPHGGEGVRPAVESAVAAFEAMKASGFNGFKFSVYKKLLARIAADKRVGQLLLKLSASLPGLAKNMVKAATLSLLEKWFTSYLSYWDILAYLPRVLSTLMLSS